MSAQPSLRGFTLLELLVVIVIIGIIAAMLTLSVGVATPESSTLKEMARIENLVRLASEEAVLGGREYGLTFYDREYEFSILDPVSRRWQPFTGQEPFQARRFPEDSIAELYIEGRGVRLALEKPPPPVEKPKQTEAPKNDPDQDDAPDDESQQEDEPESEDDESPDRRKPQVLILSSGEVIPSFELRLRPRSGGKGTWLRVYENARTERFADEV